MLLALVAIAFDLVACQTGITQAAAILERRDLYIALDRIGMPRRTMRATRMRQVLAPALVAVLGSATASALLASALLVVALTNAPLFFSAAVLALGLGLLLIRVGVWATYPILNSLLRSGMRME
ncbi:hypothetical protein [Microbacterium hydrocarbonoxydans]|uniref:hypothetical protein n=1 Tax=Microbacterium hydrocarbonoxydans TaxID=273678 RepID=UPI003D987EA7